MAELRILLINDNNELSAILKDILVKDAGYSLDIETDYQSGIESFRNNSFDVVITKFGPADLGLEARIKDLKKIDRDIIIIALLEKITPAVLREMPRLGAYDFIAPPINEEKLFFLIKKGAEMHAFSLANRRFSVGLKEQNSSLEKQNNLLSRRIEEATKNLTRLYEDLRSTYMRTIKALAQAIDARDHYTHSHSENVAKVAIAIAEELRLSAKDIEVIREACELHDLGKIGVQDNILGKPSILSPQEWEIMKKHPLTGAQILEPLTFLHDVVDLIRQHHEHFDGSGYPENLKGEEILLGARIIHLADAYEAMTSARSYRKTPLSKEKAIAEIKRNSGTQFDPRIVEVFLKVSDSL